MHRISDHFVSGAAVRSSLLLSAVAAQVTLLAGSTWIFCVGFLSAAATAFLLQHINRKVRTRFTTNLEKALTMTLVGGVVMALGRVLDSNESSPGTCVFCQDHSFGNWSNILMALFCLLACTIDHSISEKVDAPRMRAKGLCLLSMLAGMVAGHVFLVPVIAPAQASPLFMQAVMLLGMFLGNILGLLADSRPQTCSPTKPSTLVPLQENNPGLPA